MVGHHDAAQHAASDGFTQPAEEQATDHAAPRSVGLCKQRLKPLQHDLAVHPT